MKMNLAGLWQLSPLTDLSIPQDDLTLPGALSQVLPESLSEQAIRDQEWHLMHDFELTDAELANPAVDLVIGGVDYYAEVRINGRAVIDCDGSETTYRKEIRAHLQQGPNRVEILFLEYDEDDLLMEMDSAPTCSLVQEKPRGEDRMGVWQIPYLQFIPHVRLEHVAMEQIWHHGGGCEFKVDLYYQTFRAGLVSASVKFDGMTYFLPIDVRANQASALFQIEAPKYADPEHPNKDDLYNLVVELDGQKQEFDVALSQQICVTHVAL
ncbi:glycosyl hydrolase 2 galactose-binding domain-containing protein [Vibrio chaetopteri]|uniref:glycosyl hydrolase 2 galactose-binding domain-containing protein n=1 Tax=Vibrio chaetopteri TaxID=3016528 RepID=UPI003AB20816